VSFEQSEPHQIKKCFINGIFIKHVLDKSPAGLSGALRTGDRILAVDEVDLTNATHDKAVEVIRNAKSPVVFVIQSLLVKNYIPSLNEVFY
jgi:C-terminal processing protease CtpA/Prc